MGTGERIAAEALALVGTPFRLRGRCAATGLDCVGLALLAAQRAGIRIDPPPGYALRGMADGRATELLTRSGFRPVLSASPGDLILVRTGALQLHLMIRAGRGVVHAHAGLRRVVLMPGAIDWPVLGCWRFPPIESD